MMETCPKCGTPPDATSNLFCQCGRLKEPGSLKQVRLQGFSGPASLTPSIEQFWETGNIDGV